MIRDATIGMLRTRLLGIYLILVSIVQNYIYFYALGMRDWTYHIYDPRLGINVILEIVNTELAHHLMNRDDFVYVAWGTAIWLGLLGVGFAIGKVPVKTYIVSELILAAPSLFFVVLLMAMHRLNVGPGISIQELPLPALAIMLATVVPLYHASHYVRREADPVKARVVAEGAAPRSPGAEVTGGLGLPMDAGEESFHGRVLGCYLLGIALIQCILYFLILSGNLMECFYFDPRFGLSAFIDLLDLRFPFSEKHTDYLILWPTALWPALLGVGFLMGWRPVMLYIASEVILAVPSVLFFVLILVLNLISSGHGFSIQELPLPVLGMMLTTVVPISYAFQYLARLTDSRKKKAPSG